MTFNNILLTMDNVSANTNTRNRRKKADINHKYHPAENSAEKNGFKYKIRTFLFRAYSQK